MTRGASSLSCSFSAKPAGGAAVLPSGTVAFITPGHKYAQKNYMKKAYGCEPKGFISQGLPLAAEVHPRSKRKGVVAMTYITWSELLTYTLVLIAVATLMKKGK